MARQLDRLTEQELHLLRLLAQGHTAKTIANSEGLSVNVVNERLRSARRKTGAVSSRELARLIGERDQRSPQENWNNLLGVEDTPPSGHRFEPRPAIGVGPKVGWMSAMLVGVLTVVGVAAFIVSAPEAPARGKQYFPAPAAGRAAAVREWRVMSATASAPAIAFLVPSSDDPTVSIPTVIIACRSVSITVRVRGFTPQNSWPQPELTTRFGRVYRTGTPEVTASGKAPTLRYSFAIADEVLEPLGRGEPISFEFNGETVEVPTIPELQRTQFVERCAALAHPGMRRRGAASDRVY